MNCIDCAIVGAGFAGLYSIYRLRGMGLDVQCFEASDEVGGVWNFNCYPGAQCDVPSRDYCYPFSRELLNEWQWTKRYAAQPEILAYARFVADKFNLRANIQFNTRVVSARYEEASRGWLITTNRGDTVWAHFCVMACGHLSTPNTPSLPGLDTFQGEWYHTGHWPKENPDFVGKQVGVIGTGSSGIQLISSIAKNVGHLYVFQRTAQYSLPIANDPVDSEEERKLVGDYPFYREEINQKFAPAYFLDVEPRESALADSAEDRQRVYEALWKKRSGSALLRAYKDIMTSGDANETVSEFVRGKIRSIVHDPEVAERLVPKDYPIGAKRIAMDEGYFATYNRANVTLVDIKPDPIESVSAAGIRTQKAEYPLDVIVFATGYDAFTGTFFKMDIRGKADLPLSRKWEAGAVNYLGLMTSEFPNFFFIQGPGSTSVLANVLTGIDQQVNWIADCIGHMRANELPSIEPEAAAESSWLAYCHDIVSRTLFLKANSWWLGANIPGKPRVFLPFVGGFKLYRAKCDESAANGYAGFRFEAAAPLPLDSERT